MSWALGMTIVFAFNAGGWCAAAIVSHYRGDGAKAVVKAGAISASFLLGAIAMEASA